MSDHRLDDRLNAFRSDLAAEELRGKVDAPRYATAKLRQVKRAAVPLLAKPDADAGMANEVLFGEIVKVYDVADGWAWGQLARDGYVGYMRADALDSTIFGTTHRVSAIGTFVYAEADIKSRSLMHLSLNAQLAVARSEGLFVELETGGYVVSRHVSQLDRFALDFVDVGERLIGSPYLWGGRTRIGLDCSGLVQLAMEAAGLDCPRDSDMQQADIGEAVLVPDDLEGLQRGDLVFWSGHVGMMADGIMLVHANAHHMTTAIEPLATAVERISKAGSEIVAIKRPPALAR